MKGKLRLAVGLVFALINFASAQSRISLSEAIDRSLEHSYSIKSLQHDSLAAAHELSAARLASWPTLSLNVTSFYVDKLQSIDLPISTIEIGSHENYQADAKLTMPLFAGGRIATQIRLQREIASSKRYILEGERLQRAYQTRKAYLNAMLAQAAVRSAAASAARVNLINDDAKNLYRAGLADSVDILDAELALQKVARAVEENLTLSENASVMLANLIGLAPGEAVAPSDTSPVPEFAIYENLQITPELINRAESRIQRSRSRAARLAAAMTKANYFPGVNAFGGYSYGKPNKDVFNKSWNDYWTAGLNLYWEFNLGGRSIKTVRAAHESVRASEISERQLQESLVLQAEIALKNLGLAYRLYNLAVKEYDMNSHQFRLAREKERAGRLSVNRLLELEADLTAAEQTLQASRISFFIAQNDYLYAIGSPEIYGGL